jgi:hypothetical protein
MEISIVSKELSKEPFNTIRPFASVSKYSESNNPSDLIFKVDAVGLGNTSNA